MQVNWKNWTSTYGETLYKRAVGELPEMDSSKAVAKVIKRLYRPGDHVLDVGCGAGHYLRSLRRELGPDVSYTGLDGTEEYVGLARKAFASDKHATFGVSDIFALTPKDASFDIVMCNNVLLHLPRVDKPLRELARVAKRSLVVRALIGDRSVMVRDVLPSPEGEFDENGDPVKFQFYNIYSEAHIGKVLSSTPRVKSWSVTRDSDFNPDNVARSKAENSGAYNSTRMVGDFQVQGYILLPWSILEVELA